MITDHGQLVSSSSLTFRFRLEFDLRMFDLAANAKIVTNSPISVPGIFENVILNSDIKTNKMATSDGIVKQRSLTLKVLGDERG